MTCVRSGIIIYSGWPNFLNCLRIGECEISGNSFLPKFVIPDSNYVSRCVPKKEFQKNLAEVMLNLKSETNEGCKLGDGSGIQQSIEFSYSKL